MKTKQKSTRNKDEIKMKLQTNNQNLITGNFRYTGINLSGWIQEIIMNKKFHLVCLLKNSIWRIIIKLHIGLVTLN